ncbi:MAG TPA: FAD-dependent monooxygenase [Actinospica sp.]|jgi:3-(3-hydroxy-phenyl)propionate hydroxylase|nr:FAD-dependent monooxygenase [Actinospica sp.]
MTPVSTDHAVLIAGGGPTGLMLAGELALAGVDAAIIERRANQDLVGWRALGFHARTVEVLDQRGIVDRFIEQAAFVGQTTGFGGAIRLDLSDFPSRHAYGLGISQQHIERILAAWVEELGVPTLREREVAGLAQDEKGVTVELADGASLRADFLVGCDGGRSVVRKAAGIDFPGWDATGSGLIAAAEFDEEPEWGMRRDEHGVAGFSRPDPDGPIRAQAAEDHVGHGEPTLEDLRKAIIRFYGTDFGLRSAAWVTRFSDTTRQAAAYRAGRVLLAGDAAHIHSPMGGQGLGVGVQDAVNLGWKLAQVVNGISPDTLLDTYHAERHPVAARVLHNTMAQIALSRVNDRTDALRDIVADLAAMEQPRKHLAGMISGLDVHYDFGGDDATALHPLVGRRMPDLDLITTATGPTRVYTLLHTARPLLLNFGTPGARAADLAPWAARVQPIDAAYDGVWDLPVLGEVPAPTAVLVRPDGHVAWVGGNEGLAEALTTWFGPAR